MWDPQVAAFEQDFYLLRYDMRGHGSSSIPPGPYSIEDLASDVLAILDALEIPRAHFCGLSIGGVIGQWLGAYASDRLKSLVLCSTAAKIGTHETWDTRIAAVQAEGMSSIVEATLTRWLTDAFRQSNAPVIAFMKQMLESNNIAGYTAACAAVRDMDLRQAVKTITTPTLILAGESDPVTTVQDGEYLRTSITNSILVPLPAAHISNIEASETFTSEVLRFLLPESER
jgi:3-oxoadipate enol-lactonase